MESLRSRCVSELTFYPLMQPRKDIQNGPLTYKYIYLCVCICAYSILASALICLSRDPQLSKWQIMTRRGISSSSAVDPTLWSFHAQFLFRSFFASPNITPEHTSL